MRPWLLAAVLWCAVLHGRAQWREIISADFRSSQELEGWRLDGRAHASSGGGELKIVTLPGKGGGPEGSGSVLWCKTPVWGDVKIQFRCHAEPGTRAILFFNARAANPEKNIFAWQRPVASYADYAYDPRLELYTLGILRSDQNVLNLRHLGGEVPPDFTRVMPYPPNVHPAHYLSPDDLSRALASAGESRVPDIPAEVRKLTTRGIFPKLLAPHLERWREVNEHFQATSIMADHESATPVFGDSGKEHEVTLIAIGNRIEVTVDRQKIFDYVDALRAKAPLRGGYFGFRNFRPTTTWYRALRVYRREP